MWNASSASIFSYVQRCFTVPSTYHHIVAYMLLNVPFVLPLLLYILYLGARQWRSRAKISHTDVFTYNMVVLQTVASLGSVPLAINWILNIQLILVICIYGFLINASATLVFQILTCLERYVAVVHPVAYLSLKSQTWALIRNLSCSFVWLQCVVQSIGLMRVDSVTVFLIYSFLGFLFSLVVTSFCNLCVLRALLRPGPGDGAKGNASKQRALCTITAITGALLVKSAGDVLGLLSYLMTIVSNDYDMNRSCALYMSSIWFTLPSTLVLPLLFLHRNKKLLCFSQTN